MESSSQWVAFHSWGVGFPLAIPLSTMGKDFYKAIISTKQKKEKTLPVSSSCAATGMSVYRYSREIMQGFVISLISPQEDGNKSGACAGELFTRSGM